MPGRGDDGLAARRDDLNKRIYYGDMGFTSEAPALGLSCEMKL